MTLKSKLDSKSKNKVLISVPTSPANPYIHKRCVFALLNLFADSRYPKKIILPSHNPFENNLHHIVNDFLNGDYDYWLSFDSDNPPSRNPLDLVEKGLDIVGFPTPVVHFDREKLGERPIYQNAYKFVSKDKGYTEWPIKKGLQRVDAIGTGCFLVSRRVFEHPEMKKGAFRRKLNKDGTVEKGNDISFCERATEYGFKIYCHYDYPCFHFNEVEVTEMAEQFYAFYKKNPIEK